MLETKPWMSHVFCSKTIPFLCRSRLMTLEKFFNIFKHHYKEMRVYSCFINFIQPCSISSMFFDKILQNCFSICQKPTVWGSLTSPSLVSVVQITVFICSCSKCEFILFSLWSFIKHTLMNRYCLLEWRGSLLTGNLRIKLFRSIFFTVFQ